MPLCEALPSCRGLRARHAQKECTGNWEIPRLTSGNDSPWSASGRRGAKADDARTREVDSDIVAMKPTNKAEPSAAESVEPRAGTKGNAEQQSTRRAQDRENVSQGAGTHTTSCKAKEKGTV